MKKIVPILTITAILVIVLSFLTKEKHTRIPSKGIVSVSPNLTEIVFALGLGERVVGVSSECDWPEEAGTKPKMGSFWQPNTEAIIAAKPGLVVCETFLQHKEAAETLKRSGINVLSLRVETIEELLTAIEKIGQATDSNAAAERLATDIKKQIDEIREKSFLLKKVRVLWVMQTEPVRVAGVKTFINEIITLAGGQNVIVPTGEQYPSISTEELIGCNAEVIIQSAMGKQDAGKLRAEAEQFWSRFPNLPAVKDKRIYVIDPDTVLRLGPRIPQGIRKVAQCLHPELNIQAQEKTQKND